jgi:hypothetical protein
VRAKIQQNITEKKPTEFCILYQLLKINSQAARAMALPSCSSAAINPFVCTWIRKEANLKPGSNISDN